MIPQTAIDAAGREQDAGMLRMGAQDEPATLTVGVHFEREAA